MRDGHHLPGDACRQLRRRRNQLGPSSSVHVGEYRHYSSRLPLPTGIEGSWKVRIREDCGVFLDPDKFREFETDRDPRARDVAAKFLASNGYDPRLLDDSRQGWRTEMVFWSD